MHGPVVTKEKAYSIHTYLLMPTSADDQRDTDSVKQRQG